MTRFGKDTIEATFSGQSCSPVARATVDWANQVVTISKSGTGNAMEPATQGGAATTGQFTITRSSSSGSLTVFLEFFGTAIFDTDYTVSSTAVAFTAGQTTRTVTITPLFDGIREFAETVVGRIVEDSAYAIGDPGEATLYIQDKFKLIELGAFPSGYADYQSAKCVDDNGKVVGYAHGIPSGLSLSEWYGAYWSPPANGFVSSPNLLGYVYSVTPRQHGYSVNSSGVAVGKKQYNGDAPLVWPNAYNGTAAQTLPLPTGWPPTTRPLDINANSSIIGDASPITTYGVIRWDWNGSSWSPTAIGMPSTGNGALANSISDNNRVCGQARFTVNGPWLGYTTQEGFGNFANVQSLGSFTTGTGETSNAFDVHDSGGTVGWAHRRISGSNYQRAFRVAVGTFTITPGSSSPHALPPFAGVSPDTAWTSAAYSVNSSSQVVGAAQSKAFLWKPGWTSLLDLNTLAPSGWVLTSARSISDTGHIVGSGTLSGAQREWLLLAE